MDTPQQDGRYTGLVCRRCTRPVVVVRQEQTDRVEMSCPACGHTWIAPPQVKL